MKLEPLEASARRDPKKHGENPDLLRLRSEVKKMQEEIQDNMRVLTNPFLERIRSLPDKARLRYTTITDRRKQVKNTFWSTLKQNLNIIINFVDRKFVLSLFDEKYLLKKIDVSLEKLIESIIPRFESVTKSCGPFEKAVLENSKSSVEESIKVLVAGDYNRLIDKLTQKIKKEN
jgi:hypothetical protein